MNPRWPLVQRKPVDLGRLLESVVADHSTLAESRNIDLGIEAPCQLVIDADEDSLRVLLNNLVDNALRYTQEGGRIDLQACHENGRTVLRVRDNGPACRSNTEAGCSTALPAGRPAGWGAGLGLSIVRNIATTIRPKSYCLMGWKARIKRPVVF
jgi:two-component system OmpR family sensor kinase